MCIRDSIWVWMVSERSRPPSSVTRVCHTWVRLPLCSAMDSARTFPCSAAMGLRTATLESKTNFFAAATAGKLRAEATALHKGRRTHVWQTRVTDESGRLLALTIQTQMIL